ncbi:MAG: flavin reductase family protein [Thermodesulfobacteriota bacterium]
MAKTRFPPGTMLYPLPAALVTCAWGGACNVLTISWIGTVCTDPPMLSVSIRPERHSYEMVRQSGEFAVNLPGRDMARAVDFCGVNSGRDVDKFARLGLATERAAEISAPLLAACPVNLECRVTEVKELGSHHMFLARVLAVWAEERLLNEKGLLRLGKAQLLAYCHGQYRALAEPLGSFGFSVRKKDGRRKS